MSSLALATDGIPGLSYQPGWLESTCADALLERLWSDLDWSQRAIEMYGRKIPQPRLTAWLGDEDACYRYSGLDWEPAPWHPELQSLRERLRCELVEPFNSVLVNAYRDGHDAMGFHADNEPELGPQPVVASVSLGSERRFLVRPVTAGRSLPIHLGHGSLLVMSGNFQREYRHAVPRTKRPVGLRINLTFRTIQA